MMIRALDAERSLDFYRRAFDLNITGRFAFDDFEHLPQRQTRSI